ncbi:uncharacterized protein [Atheta coriaria]|uniref:uncharacterized protein n=1 Tax=Dalotia coriaria TaxID=877792 RepID=UPI0031F38327
MKVILIMIVAVVYAEALHTKENAQLIQENLKKCGEELGIDVTPLTPGPKLDFSIMDDEKYKCLPKCFLEKFGFIDASGNYQPEKVKEVIPDLPAEITAISDACVKQHTEDDLCTRFMGVHKCLMDKFTH